MVAWGGGHTKSLKDTSSMPSIGLLRIEGLSYVGHKGWGLL